MFKNGEKIRDTPSKKTKIKSIDGGKKNKNKTTEPHTYKTTQDSQNIFSLFHYIFFEDFDMQTDTQSIYSFFF